jgi:hypothetical protein
MEMTSIGLAIVSFAAVGSKHLMRGVWSRGAARTAALAATLSASWFGCALIVGVEDVSQAGASGQPGGGGGGGGSGGEGAGGVEHVWSSRYGDAKDQSSAGIAVDKKGNAFITGLFEGDLDFDASNPLTNPNNSDLFVAAFAPDGHSLWSRSYGNADGLQYGSSVAVDGVQGTALVVGSFSGTLDFGGNPITTQGDTNIFVASFGGGSEVYWYQSFGDSGDQYGNGAAVDASGASLITGSYAGAIISGAESISSLDESIFVGKLGPTGDAIWLTSLGDDVAPQMGNGIAATSDGVVVTGRFGGSIVISPMLTLTSNGDFDFFVAKIDASGNPQGGLAAGDGGFQEGRAIAVDGSDNVFVIGKFEGELDLGFPTTPLVSKGSFDVFVAKFNFTNAPEWSRSFGDAAIQQGNAVAVDGAGDVYITGSFFGTIDLGPGEPLSAAGANSNIFMAKLDGETGATLWSRNFGSAGGNDSVGLAVDTGGNLLLAGNLGGAADFGGGILESKGEHDVVIAKFKP